jgi:hypothetical protein
MFFTYTLKEITALALNVILLQSLTYREKLPIYMPQMTYLFHKISVAEQQLLNVFLMLNIRLSQALQEFWQHLVFFIAMHEG